MPLEQDVLWYKRAIIYQAHVRTFYDSNGDGVGDFPGLDQKLDYLEELGINTIWLMPFFPVTSARRRLRYFGLLLSPFQLRNLGGFQEDSWARLTSVR